MGKSFNILTIILIIVAVGFNACEKKSTKSDKINCNDLSISNNSPYYPFICSGTFNSTISNIQYDQYARRTSYDFDISCSPSNETLEGRFYNMTYNSIGQLQTFDATINGKNCSYP
jgi:hypothetical protein